MLEATHVKNVREENRFGRPSHFPLQVSTRLNLLLDSEYCTLHFAAHSQPQNAERLSGKQEHKPKSGGNMKKIEGGSDETESAPSA